MSCVIISFAAFGKMESRSEKNCTRPFSSSPLVGSSAIRSRAREQAASCQRVLGGVANVAAEYATKRYRSNVVNWGMLPFIAADVASWNIQPGDQLWIPGVKAALEGDVETLNATLIQNGMERVSAQSDPRGAGHYPLWLSDQLL